jgi:hypothetical protein
MVAVHDNAIVDKTNLAYRRAGDRVIPFEPQPFEPHFLTEAIVGYSSPLTPEAARLVMVANGFTATARRSDVPVR